MKKRLLSGMRPTGPLHLGHLVGALRNWAYLQDKYECFFMVADWHAHMSEYENPQDLKRYTLDNVIDWISCGIDAQRSTLFVQSHIEEHTQLHLLFSNITPLGWLKRCPTYKEQLREIKSRDLHTYGFLGYPADFHTRSQAKRYTKAIVCPGTSSDADGPCRPWQDFSIGSD